MKSFLPKLLLFITILFYSNFLNAQNIIVESISLNNSYGELAHLNNSVLLKPIFDTIEQELIEKYGAKEVTFYNRNSLCLNDESHLEPGTTAIHHTPESYKSKRIAKSSKATYSARIRLEIADPNRKDRNNFKVISTIVMRDADYKKIAKSKGVVKVNVPDVPFNLSSSNGNNAKIYKAFPMTDEDLQKVIIQSLQQAFKGQKRYTSEITIERSETQEYEDFIASARQFKYLINNMSMERFYLSLTPTFNKRQTVMVIENGSNRTARYGIKERIMSNTQFRFGLGKKFSSQRIYKKYKLTSDFRGEEGAPYYINSVLLNNRILGGTLSNNSIDIKISTREKDDIGKLEFIGGVQHRKDWGRILHNYASLEGYVEGHHFSIRSNPSCLNAAEIRIDNELVGLITHAIIPKKYLGKNTNSVPFYVYLSENIKTEDKPLLLQSLQLLRVAYALEGEQRRILYGEGN